MKIVLNYRQIRNLISYKTNNRNETNKTNCLIFRIFYYHFMSVSNGQESTN